jgi:hypothetical protein
MTKKNDEKVKADVLSYIQENSFALRAKYPLFDVAFANNPPRLVLVSSKDIPMADFENLQFPVEVKVEEQVVAQTVGQEVEKPSLVYSIDSKEGKKVLGLTELPNALNVEQTNSAVEAWKKRHSNVKVGD